MVLEGALVQGIAHHSSTMPRRGIQTLGSFNSATIGEVICSRTLPGILFYEYKKEHGSVCLGGELNETAQNITVNILKIFLPLNHGSKC